MKRKLNFGCGTLKYKDFYNVDIIETEGIDKSFDFNEFPYPLEDNQFDYILVHSVLEHCLFPRKVLEELRRVCRNGANIEITVPYINSRSATADIEHCSFFSRWSFKDIGEVHLHDKEGIQQQKFKVIKNKSNPQRFIKWIPTPILNFLSVILNNIYVDIDVLLEIVKEEVKE